MVNNLDDRKFNKLSLWLNIHQNVGFAKIQLYLSNIDKFYQKELETEFGTFLKIVEYKTSYLEICEWQIKKANQFNNSYFYKSLLNYCKYSHQIYFEISDEYVKNAHERICTNDCLLKSKFEFEYLSNYDFDEFIFPRHYNLKYHIMQKLNENDSCENYNKSLYEKQNNLPKYNFYKYIRKINDFYGNNMAYFHFENVLFLNNFQFVRDEAIKLVEKLSNNDNIDTEFVYIQPYNSINYTIDVINDFNFLKSFKEYNNYIKCLNQTITKNSRIDSKWNNLYSTLVNYRDGKSVYNTELTITLNQHLGEELKPDSKWLRIPIELGYVSHFRELDFGLPLKYPFNYLNLDLEYYNFLYQFSQYFQ